jgi:Flp pilus assembly protein CpaB
MGAVTARPVPAGSYLTAAYLEGRGDPSAVGAGERVIEIPVTGSAAVGPARPGTRVDVLVTSESRAGRGDTRVALEGAELLRLSRGGGRGAGLDGSRADGTAQLLVSPAQAVTLTTAANFAREIRLLQRPVGDTRRIGALSARDLAR